MKLNKLHVNFYGWSCKPPSKIWRYEIQLFLKFRIFVCMLLFVKEQVKLTIFNWTTTYSHEGISFSAELLIGSKFLKRMYDLKLLVNKYIMKLWFLQNWLYFVCIYVFNLNTCRKILLFFMVAYLRLMDGQKLLAYILTSMSLMHKSAIILWFIISIHILALSWVQFLQH